jgi:hypothetical protein
VSAHFSPESLAKSLNALNSEAVTRFKQAAHRAAEVLCFEHEAETWLKQLKAIQ